MRYSNRITSLLPPTALGLVGAVIADSGLAMAGDFPVPGENNGEFTWTATESPQDVVDVARDSIKSELRNEMITALKPNSAVWKGALDGHLLAQEMRDNIAAQAREEMIAGMQAAMAELPGDGDFKPRTEKADTPAPVSGQLASQADSFLLPTGMIWP